MFEIGLMLWWRWLPLRYVPPALPPHPWEWRAIGAAAHWQDAGASVVFVAEILRDRTVAWASYCSETRGRSESPVVGLPPLPSYGGCARRCCGHGVFSAVVAAVAAVVAVAAVAAAAAWYSVDVVLYSIEILLSVGIGIDVAAVIEVGIERIDGLPVGRVVVDQVVWVGAR